MAAADLKWYGIKSLWYSVKKVVFFFRWLVGFASTIVSSVLAWVIAGIAWLINLVWGWMGEAISNFMSQWVDVNIGNLPVYPLATWIARDLLALDFAYTVFSIYFSFWLSAKVARASGMVVRAILDLL